MSVRNQRTGSAAFALLILAMTFFIGGLLITVLNLPMQDIFASQIFAFDTTHGTRLGNWLQEIWAWIGFIGLLALMYAGFVLTRRE